METQDSLRRLRLFLPLRLASYVILMAVVAIWMKYPQYLHFQTILYSVLTLGFAVTLALEKRYRLTRVTYLLVALQFLLEISIESGVIYATGNINSPFSALLVLTIVSAALAYRIIGTLIVASLVSIAYAFIIWLGLASTGDSAFSMQALRTIFSTHESVFYAILLHILIFYLTAFMSGYLADRLSSQDQKLADTSRALKRARLETDDILRHLNSGLLTIDTSGSVIYFNRAAEKILGYSEEKVRGLSYRDVFSERMPELVDFLANGVDGGLAYPRAEVEVTDQNGERIPLGLSTSILTEEGGELRGVIAIFSDLTEAKALENKVRASDRLAAVGELSASIAHEIRNPLAAISGSVEVLQNELTLSGQNANLMELIVKESLRLNKILTDFLTYARISRPTYSKVELCHIVSDVCELLCMHSAVPANIDIAFETGEAIVYVIGDEDLIKQLLVNLAINACEALDGREGRVEFHLTVDASRGLVELRVIDDGPGIMPEHLEKIYQPFFSTKKQGTGLGLAIVHRICNALRLKLQVESKLKQGTTFSVLFTGYRQGQPALVAGRQSEPGRQTAAV